ncbi:MAG: dipeptidase [bacterium]|nr:MAG: dipeptidase [bacterium]
MKRAGITLLLIFAISCLSAFLSCGQAADETRDLHFTSLIFDAHCDTAMRLVGEERIDLGERHESGHMDLPRMAEGGLDAQIFACFLSPELPKETWIKRVLQMIDAVWEQANRHPNRLEVALKGTDVRRIVDGGKVAAIIGIEGGHAIMDDLCVLRNYYRLGVRCMTLTWNNTNNWADSSTDTMRWGGLNELGRKVVGEMDRLGMIIDCSHVSDSTLFDVFETTTNPVLISHSCARALADVARNVSDDGLRALKENGGVICVNYFPGFIDKVYFEQAVKLWEELRADIDKFASRYGGDRGKTRRELRPAFREKMAAVRKPTISDLIDHIDYIVGIIGIDHVGLGSDFDGISFGPEGLEDVSRLPAITEELARRGYSDGDIRKILGGNLLRLVERVCR